MRPLFRIAGLCSGWIVWDACGTISFFTQIPAEKTRRLVRRGGFFVLGTKPLRLRFFARHNFSNELISSIRSAAVRREGFFVLRGLRRKVRWGRLVRRGGSKKKCYKK
jgi:hypothetical protein